MVDQNKTMAGKSPDRLWETVDYKISGQLKRLEREQAELLKIFDRLVDVEIYLAQNKTVSAEKNVDRVIQIGCW